MAVRWSAAGTVSFSWTLSDLRASSSIATSSSSDSRRVRAVAIVGAYWRRTRLSIVRLYNSAVSGNCYKVRLLFAHLDLEYETVEMSVVDRSNRPDVLGELNPGL